MAGKRWSFIDGAHPVQILGRGWAAPSDGGLWNDGTSATLRLNETDRVGVPAVLSIEGQTFSYRQRVKVCAGETLLAEFILPQGTERGLVIPPNVLTPGQSVRLEFPDADIPYNVGFNDDLRTLALRLTGVEWRPVEAEARALAHVLGAFVVRPVPGVLRVWGQGRAPDARFRLNGATVFSCPVSDGDTWSAWIVVSPQQAHVSRLRLDIYQTTDTPFDVAGIDQFAAEDESAGGLPVLLHMAYRAYERDVREIEERSEVSLTERVERRLYALVGRPALVALPSLPEEPSAPLPQNPAIPTSAAPASDVQATYNAAARLLMIRIALDVEADEVRIWADDGDELARVRPLGFEAKAAVICAPDRLPHHLTIRSYLAADCVAEQVVPGERIQQIELEVAAMTMSETEIRGAFWTRSNAGADWQVTCHDIPQGHAQSSDARTLNDLSITAVPFRMPLPDRDIQPAHGGEPGDGIFITPKEPGGPIPVQRPLTLSRVQLKGPRHASPELAALRDAHRGKVAWIIGNGPSVRLEDLATIPTGDVVFAFNRFYLSYPDHPLREDYVVSADAQMIADFGQEMIEQSSGLPLFCLPRETLTHLRGRCIALTPGDSPLPVFSTNPAHFVSVGGSSVFVALQMAYYMGLRDIRLYGMDYSFNTVLSHDLGSEALMAVNDGNHFIENYRGDRPWYPPSWADIATGFLNARIAFELDEGRIVNATRGGRLETFPRKEIKRLIAGQY